MNKQLLHPVNVRLPKEILDRLPPPSLTGERAEYLRDAIIEKLDRDEKKKKAKKK